MTYGSAIDFALSKKRNWRKTERRVLIVFYFFLTWLDKFIAAIFRKIGSKKSDFLEKSDF